MTINDYYELLALHKALLEVKYNLNANNTDLRGSPIIAKISNDILLELIDFHASKGDSKKVSEWNAWRKDFLSRTTDVAFVKEMISRMNDWNELEKERKIARVKTYTSPFILNDEEMQMFIDFGDEYFG